MARLVGLTEKHVRKWVQRFLHGRIAGIRGATLLKGKSTRSGLYKCRACEKPFSVTVGTVYERSKIRLNKGSIGIILSVLRLRLFYSPFYNWLRPLRPLEGWIYKKLRAPQPLPGPRPR